MAEPKKEPIKEPIRMLKLMNPTSENLEFKWDSAIYALKAGKQDEFISYIAEMGAKRLADKNILTNDPAEHAVLMQSYLENSTPEAIAQRMGVDLAKIRKEALTKEKEKARVINLEAQSLGMREEMKQMKEELKALKEDKKAEPIEKETVPVPKSGTMSTGTRKVKTTKKK